MHPLLKSPWPYVLLIAIVAVMALQIDFVSDEHVPEETNVQAEAEWDLGSLIKRVDAEREPEQEALEESLETHPDRSPPDKPVTLEDMKKR